MNSEQEIEHERDVEPEPAAAIEPPRWRWFWGPIKWVVGALLTQTPATAILVAGWLQKYLQREVYRGWWKRCRGRVGRFDEFVAEEPLLSDMRHAPNWLFAPNFRSAWKSAQGPGRFGKRLALMFGSIGRLLRAGLSGWANVALLTLPAGILWATGWWGGWQNSFHKGYEQFGVGPSLSLLGIALFIAAMFYVPMAMARQASTGSWRSFWEGRTVWTLVRSSWLSSAVVAVLFAGCNWLAMGLKSFPQFIPQVKLAFLANRGLEPGDAFLQGSARYDWSNLTDSQALEVVNVHFLVSALLVFLLLVRLKKAQAWLYSGAVLRAVRSGVLGVDRLSDQEWRVLHSLGAMVLMEKPTRSWFVRFVGWAGTKVGRSVCFLALVLAWFAFVGAIYVSEFVTYHPVVGWLNQPLIHLPWFRYVPPALEDPAPSLLAAAALAVLVLWSGSRRKTPDR